jgi:AAA15 family ATPase/GTPase
MIVTFSVSNFRSFDEEVTFSMVASKKLGGSHDSHLVEIPGSDQRVLRAGAMYGPNGAGKSNFFKALNFLRSKVVYARVPGKGTGRDPFRFNVTTGDSTFDLQLIAGGKLFRYGLEMNDESITSEWLYEVRGNKQSVVFERVTDGEGNVNVTPGPKTDCSAKLKALMTVGGPKEQTFLSTIKANLNLGDIGADTLAVMEWFDNRIQFVRPNSNFMSLGHTLALFEGFKDFASTFLRFASTGVDDLVVEKKEIREEELKLWLPGDLINKVLEDTEEDGKSIVRIGDSREVLIEKAGEHRYFLLTIKAVHSHESDSTVIFDMAEESDGTRRLLNLLPALHQLHTDGGIFFIDEIERSMHPNLVFKLIQFFLSECTQANQQLIFTTHETNLLDLKLLRRDEIWFADKDSHGATQLYSLLDYKTRNDLKIDKHYLQGRFDAVPVLSGLDRLIEGKIEELDKKVVGQ